MLSSRFLDDLKERKEIGLKMRCAKTHMQQGPSRPPGGFDSPTSPSLLSTVRTRMLLFTCASGVLVSRLVSKRIKRNDFRGRTLEDRKISRGGEWNALNVNH